MINFMIRKDVKTNGYCRVTSSSELKEYGSFAFQLGFPKGSSYVPAFNELIFCYLFYGVYKF